MLTKTENKQQIGSQFRVIKPNWKNLKKKKMWTRPSEMTIKGYTLVASIDKKNPSYLQEPKRNDTTSNIGTLINRLVSEKLQEQPKKFKI